MNPDEGFFMEKPMGHERTASSGKSSASRAATTTRRPRTKATTSGCGCRKFELRRRSRSKQIMTFVLGLVAEPPAQRSTSTIRLRAARRSSRAPRSSISSTAPAAMLLSLEKWKLAFDTGSDSSAVAGEFKDYAFLRPHFSPADLQGPGGDGQRGRRHALITGVAAVDAKAR